jgi:molybdopterin biosynthesis enzyme
MFVVGGSGLGAHDRSVAMLRRAGDVVAHGLALDPGRTGAAALIRGKPAICIPGRFDSALAVYLALAAPMLRRLSAGPLLRAREAPLARKIASTVGLAQIVLLEAHGDAWAPLAVGDLTLAHLMRASAYLIIPEGSEGLAEGSAVAPLRLPGRS